MINQDIIEEHPTNQPPPWVSNAVIASKTDGSIRMTFDARNVNKAIIPTNHPIPHQSKTRRMKMVFKNGLYIPILANRTR